MVVFLLGAISGIGGSAIVVVQRQQYTFRNPQLAEGPASRVIERIGNDLEDHLDLTPEKRGSVSEELAVCYMHLLEIRIKLLQEIRGVASGTVGRVENRLPKEKHDTLRQRVKERLESCGIRPER